MESTGVEPAGRRADVRRLPLVSNGDGLLVDGPLDGGDAGSDGASYKLLPDGDELLQAGDKLLRVGDVAKMSGKTVRAIHHYEDVGLLRPSARSKGRYRLYDSSALTRVRWIGKLHDLGFSLAEIQEVVATWEASPSAPRAMSTVRSLYQEKLEATRAQIARLTALERELAASVRYLDTCDTCDPAELVAACSACHVRPASDSEPELVSGIYSSQRGISSSPKKKTQAKDLR